MIFGYNNANCMITQLKINYFGKNCSAMSNGLLITNSCSSILNSYLLLYKYVFLLYYTVIEKTTKIGKTLIRKTNIKFEPLKVTQQDRHSMKIYLTRHIYVGMHLIVTNFVVKQVEHSILKLR